MSKLTQLFSPRDMTLGEPWQRIAEFTVPMLVGNLAQQLYNTADTVIVGNYIGDNALAAVGSASPILNLLLALFVGISTGAGILVSQYFGAKNREALSKTICNCLTLTLIATGIIMLLGPFLSEPLLRLIDTPESIIAWCKEYLNIFFIGIIGFFSYNILSGILRGLGDSLSSLGFLIIATGLNIVLDLLLVQSMGVAGVALATVLAQGISAILCYIKLMRMNQVFDIRLEHFKLEKTYSMAIIKLGLPSGLTQAIFSAAMILVQNLTNSFGEMVIAANVIVMRVDGFAMMPNFSFGQALSTFTAQNVGAGRLDRLQKGFKQGTIMAMSFATVLTIVILVFGRALMTMFTDTAALIDLGYRMVTFLAVGYIAFASMQCMSGVMRGAGDTVTPMWISLIITVVIRTPIAYLIAHLTRSPEYPTGQPEALYISLLISWVLGAGINLICYRRGVWRRKLDLRA